MFGEAKQTATHCSVLPHVFDLHTHIRVTRGHCTVQGSLVGTDSTHRDRSKPAPLHHPPGSPQGQRCPVTSCPHWSVAS